jgi:predicted Zn finger-like uncharacterized protein
MPTIVDCPSCNRKLRVPDELLGKKVKCPTCSGTFDALADSAPTELHAPASPADDATSLAKSVEPQLELPNQGQAPTGLMPPSPAPPLPSETPPGSAPPSEQETLTHPVSEPPGDQDLEACPYCGEKIARDATRCRFCGEELTEDDKTDRPWDREYRPYRDVRRDSEPHRGTLILTLGIISIVITAASACTYGAAGFIGLIMGICVWVMGQRDLKKMRSNQMDPQGLGTTQAGWICGIIGTVSGALATLFCGVIVTLFIVMAQSASQMTPSPGPPPVTPRPAGPVVRPAPAPAKAPGDPAPPPAKKDE